MVVETSIRTGDQCIICVARVVNLHQSIPASTRPSVATEDNYPPRQVTVDREELIELEKNTWDDEGDGEARIGGWFPCHSPAPHQPFGVV